MCPIFLLSPFFTSILVELPWSQLDNLIQTSMEQVQESFPNIIKSYSLTHPIKFEETESKIWLWIWVGLAIAMMLILIAITLIVCLKWTKHKHALKDDQPECPKKGAIFYPVGSDFANLHFRPMSRNRKSRFCATKHDNPKSETSNSFWWRFWNNEFLNCLKISHHCLPY